MRFIDLSFIFQIDTEETTCHLNMSHLKIYFILFYFIYLFNFGKGELNLQMYTFYFLKIMYHWTTRVKRQIDLLLIM